MIKGKLKHSLKERCPRCKAVLQVRTVQVKGLENGIEVLRGEDFVECSQCDYEYKLKGKRKRRKEEDYQ